MWPFPPGWKTVANEAQVQRAEAIRQSAANLPAADEAYLRATASEIVRRIGSGEWTAVAVMKAYIARASVAQYTTNCLTEIMFEQALNDAEELDREFASTKRIRGPLHGVPISLKDMYSVKGFDATVGFTTWRSKPSQDDAEVVKHLRAAGGIPFVKTNVPQTLLSFECSNPLWGRTTNPYSSAHTPGGSSGGEGALLAMDGSVIGIGSDVGGSLRIPAHFCGVYSIKPSVGRISTVGVLSTAPGFESIRSVMGPMGRSVGDIELTCRTLFGVSSKPSEGMAPVPYRDIELPNKLRFGYYLSDDFVKASPACRRAVQETVDALTKAGHECIEFSIPQSYRAFKIFASLTSADGYRTLLSNLGPDPQEKTMWLVTLGPRLPSIVRNLACWLVRTLTGDKIFADVLNNSREKTVQELYEWCAARDEYIRTFYREVWDKYDLDGIIAPVSSTPAVPHGATQFLAPLAAATILYNLVDSPVGTIPVTRVDPEFDQLSEKWKAGEGHGSPLLEEGLYTRGRPPVYNPVAMKGLPVGVQVVGKKWEDEKVIALMDVVDKALGARGFGPGAWSPS